jgi:hypothetical protein
MAPGPEKDRGLFLGYRDRVETPARIAGGGRQQEEADFAYPRFNPRGGPLPPLPLGSARCSGAKSPPLRSASALSVARAAVLPV